MGSVGFDLPSIIRSGRTLATPKRLSSVAQRSVIGDVLVVDIGSSCRWIHAFATQSDRQFESMEMGVETPHDCGFEGETEDGEAKGKETTAACRCIYRLAGSRNREALILNNEQIMSLPLFRDTRNELRRTHELQRDQHPHERDRHVDHRHCID
jgi:hypothetical protein